MHSEAEAASVRLKAASALLRPGYNCCALETAHQAAILVDAEAYFAALDAALRKARHSIVILAWDFDARIRLRPQDGEDTPILGTLLRDLVEERPELEVRILVWSLAAVHAPGASLPLVVGEEWQNHPRIHLHLDTNHPLYAAHHQKIVTVDDSLAFVGGMDLTIERWDVQGHAAAHALRVRPDGEPYDPVHDVQAVVDGPAARAVARVAHERWREARGEALSLLPPVERWPDGLRPDLTGVTTAISRTAPRYGARRPVKEVVRLTDDLLRRARETVYIEAQYFASKRVRQVLCEVLSRPEGPEVVVVSTRIANGVIERFIMGANRERLLRRLKRADRHNRLHVYYPVVPGLSDGHRLLVHAKVMIVDDRFLRVGSSNLNNRSVGLDTECDLTFQADGAEQRAAVLACRDRLLAEHLAVEPAELQAAVAAEGSLAAAIDRLRRDGHGLQPMTVGPGPTHSFPGTRLLDPEGPFHFLEWLRSFFTRSGRQRRRDARAMKASESAKDAPPSTSGSRK